MTGAVTGEWDSAANIGAVSVQRVVRLGRLFLVGCDALLLSSHAAQAQHATTAQVTGVETMPEISAVGE
jgi:hypothetical protein